MLHPTAGAAKMNAFNENIGALFQINILRARAVLVLEICPLPVDGTSPANRNILQVLAGDDGPGAKRLASRSAEFTPSAVVPLLFTPEKHTAGIELKGHVTFQIDRPCKPRPGGEINRPPSVFGALVDGLLNRLSAKGRTVRFGAEIEHIICFPNRAKYDGTV